MSVESDLIRGHTETIILAQLLAGPGYGYDINKAIKERTAGRYELKEATLYSAFRRLEKSGSITSFWGDESSGARRRYYQITSLGREQYQANLRAWKNARTIIDLLLGREDEN